MGDNSIRDIEERCDKLEEKEIDVLIKQYLRLREDTMTNIRIHNQRVLSGIASLGAVTGYALVAEGYWLVSLTPIIFALMAMESAVTMRYLAAGSSVSIRIEERLSEVTHLFPWEGKYGGLYGKEPELLKNSPFSFVVWDDILRRSVIIIAAISYFILIYLSYMLWPTRPPEILFVDRGMLVILYTIITVVASITVAISFVFVREVDPTS